LTRRLPAIFANNAKRTRREAFVEAPAHGPRGLQGVASLVNAAARKIE
jgi:hypothetical protein